MKTLNKNTRLQMHYARIGHLSMVTLKQKSRQHFTRISALVTVAAISQVAQLAMQLAIQTGISEWYHKTGCVRASCLACQLYWKNLCNTNHRCLLTYILLHSDDNFSYYFSVF